CRSCTDVDSRARHWAVPPSAGKTRRRRSLGNLALQCRSIPPAEKSGAFVGALEKRKKRLVGILGRSHCLVRQDEIAQTLVEKGRCRFYRMILEPSRLRI